MTVRSAKGERLGLLLAFIAPLFLAGCTSSPDTTFDWGVRDAAHHHKTVVAERHTKPVRPAWVCENNDPVPTPRPTPAWYEHSTSHESAAPAHDAPPPHDADEAPQASNARFVWPLSGRVISDYGATTGGERNDGINIAASYGEPIRAAADGTVSYSGNDLKSYGNLALIKHDDGYITAYAHADRFIVERGDHVAKGQVIGYAGTTGDVRAPQLHFEIRRGVKPVNPLPLLGKMQVAER